MRCSVVGRVPGGVGGGMLAVGMFLIYPAIDIPALPPYDKCLVFTIR